MRRVSLLLLLLWIVPGLAVEQLPPVRIGLAAVVLTGGQAYLQRWGRYLEQKTGRSIEFDFLNSCRKVTDSMQAGDIDFAWIGGYCFVKSMDLGYLKLMTVPVYRGEPLHRSLIIVHRDSPLTRVGDLQGKLFAFSDQDSNTGFAYPLTLMPRRERNPSTYYRQAFFTYSHAKTVQAVAEQVADGGAVDSYVWEYLASHRPDITMKTRIIRSSASFGFPPLVSRAGVEVETVEKIKAVFEAMHKNPAGKSLLSELNLDEFRQYPSSLFNNTRKVMNLVGAGDAR